MINNGNMVADVPFPWTLQWLVSAQHRCVASLVQSCVGVILHLAGTGQTALVQAVLATHGASSEASSKHDCYCYNCTELYEGVFQSPIVAYCSSAKHLPKCGHKSGSNRRNMCSAAPRVPQLGLGLCEAQSPIWAPCRCGLSVA